MSKLIYIQIILLALFLSACQPKIVKVACVGDSITEGYRLACQSKTSYPVMLDSILGPGYTVLNFGRSGTTVEKEGNFPFWICKEFSNVFALQPDIILIKLGTNDTKPQNWNADKFEIDYQALIDTLKTIPGHPEIRLCLPVPVFETRWGINDSTVTKGVIPIVEKLSRANNLPIIDLYSGMKNEGENFPDGIHPNEKALKVMAGLVADEILKKK